MALATIECYFQPSQAGSSFRIQQFLTHPDIDMVKKNCLSRAMHMRWEVKIQLPPARFDEYRRRAVDLGIGRLRHQHRSFLDPDPDLVTSAAL